MTVIKWFVRTIAKAFVFLVAIALAIFIGLAVTQAGECPSWACPNSTGAVTRNIVVPSDTGIGGRIIGDLYTPYPGARTQVREHSDTGIVNTIRAYIEPDGTITDADTRREIGNIDGLFK